MLTDTRLNPWPIFGLPRFRFNRFHCSRFAAVKARERSATNGSSNCLVASASSLGVMSQYGFFSYARNNQSGQAGLIVVFCQTRRYGYKRGCGFAAFALVAAAIIVPRKEILMRICTALPAWLVL